MDISRLKHLAGINEFQGYTEYKGPLSDKQKMYLKKGYKLDKDGVPYWEPDGDKVSPFYQDELGPGWDKASLDKDGDEIMPGSSDFFDKARKDPNSSYNANTTTDFSGGGYTTTTRTDKGTKVDKFPSINAKVSTTTKKKKGGKLKTDVKFKGNL
jgi:hypothetical protein